MGENCIPKRKQGHIVVVVDGEAISHVVVVRREHKHNQRAEQSMPSYSFISVVGGWEERGLLGREYSILLLRAILDEFFRSLSSSFIPLCVCCCCVVGRVIARRR